MNINVDSSQSSHHQFKALMKAVTRLGLDLGGYGEIAYNSNSGYFYYWNEDYNFSVGACDFQDDVEAIYSCPVDGEEEFKTIGSRTTLDSLQKWADKLSRESDRK